MSTKMHNYRLSKDSWWDFAMACRQFYQAKHPVMEVLKAISDTPKFSSYVKMTKAVDVLIDAEWTADLQVFDEGDTLILRPLEHGYFFMNNADEWAGFGLERVYYDDRSDVPPEDEKNRIVSQWVDEKVFAGQYMVLNLLSRSDFHSFCFDQMLKGM